MNQRSDFCAAELFRPKLAQMIEWNLNGHHTVLARSVRWIERSALDVIYAAEPHLFGIVRGAADPPSPKESGNHDGSYRRTTFSEPFAVARIKCHLPILRHANLASENAFAKRIARIVAQDLRNAAELVDKTGYACVSGTDHGPAIFNTTKNRV